MKQENKNQSILSIIIEIVPFKYSLLLNSSQSCQYNLLHFQHVIHVSYQPVLSSSLDSLFSSITGLLMELRSVVETVSAADVGGAPLYNIESLQCFESLCMHCGENVVSLSFLFFFSLIVPLPKLFLPFSFFYHVSFRVLQILSSLSFLTSERYIS